ncbi:MAG: hypothetical protein WA655_00800 [Candidatus Korobacteraceae bacterium]
MVGIVLAEVDNLAASIAENFASGRDWIVQQQWVAIGSIPASARNLPLIETSAKSEPKFTILNRILAKTSLQDFDYVIIVDDDIELPPSFLDRYLALVERYDFALAQPARTHDSYIDHPFVEQLDGIVARQTLFVEIGPLFSIRADALPFLLPFDLTSPMGWGYDLVWPLTMMSAKLTMGIVDAVPVRHKLRQPVSHYDHSGVSEQMEAYLANRPHLNLDEAFVIVESFSGD